MSRWCFLLLVLFFAAPVWAGGLSTACAEALSDARKRDPVLVQHDRYLWIGDIELKDQRDAIIALTFQANQLSRRPTFIRLERAGREVLRLNLLEFGWKRETWERFLDVPEPFFHQTLEINEPWQRNYGRGRIEYFNKRVRKQASALWLDPNIAANLIAITQTQVPVVNARWWFTQVSRQVGLNNKENGVGYYDWFGIKKRDDFFKVIALNEKASLEFGKVMRAAIVHSGVSEQNRQIERLQALGGGSWYTLDTTDSTGQGNAIRNLGRGEMRHDAERHYGVLPNGLFAYLLCNAKGELQATAPDFIGPDDSLNAGKAGRIHVNLGCVRCHVEGLRPVDDWVRKNLRKPLGILSPDYLKVLEIEQQYFSNLDRQLAADRKVYEDALGDLNGLTPVQMAKAYTRFYDSYVKGHKAEWTLQEIARMTGMGAEEMLGKIKQYAEVNKGIDLLLSPFLTNPNYGLRVEQMEETMAELMRILGYPKR